VNGIHDLGGLHGFGPVLPEANEPVFHHPWEGTVFALTLAAGSLGRWNLDMSRSAREGMPAAQYLATSYYEHWLFGLEALLDKSGLVSRRELEDRTRDPGSPCEAVSREGLRVLRRADVQSVLRDPRGARQDEPLAPGFHVGDRVRVRNLNSEGHTRLPRYCRGREGQVTSDHGVWVFPDTHAAGQGKKPQHVYGVRFSSQELWGAQGRPGDFIHVDLWEDYLEPVPCPG
jgi:nitrile hydratase